MQGPQDRVRNRSGALRVFRCRRQQVEAEASTECDHREAIVAHVEIEHRRLQSLAMVMGGLTHPSIKARFGTSNQAFR